MSEARLELVESCGDGLFHDRRELHGVETVDGKTVRVWCDGVSRVVLSVPTVEMVEAALDAFYDPPPGSAFVTERMRAALTAAFNMLGIQETRGVGL